jgi:hypothetical protein
MRRTLGFLCFSGPFVAGAVAAVSARRDFRLIAMGIIATVAAWIIPRRTLAPFAGVATAFGVATVGAVIVALVAGARSPFGVIAVSVVVAAFAAAGRYLLSTARGTPNTLDDPAA